MPIRLSISAPASEPVTRTEAKTWLKVRSAYTADDDLIDGMIAAARQEYEHEADELTITRQVIEYFDTWPTGSTIVLSAGPVSAVSSVKYLDENGDEQTFSAANYTVDKVGKTARIVLNEDYDWPDLQNVPNAVYVTYSAGYADADSVPDTAKLAIKVRLAMIYDNRGDMPLSGVPGKRTFESLSRRRRRNWI